VISQLAPALLATVIGLLLDGSLRGLTRPLALWPLGLAAILVELLLSRVSAVDQPWILVLGHWLWVGTVVGVLLVALANARRDIGRARLPWLIASLGVALNLSVILANGGYMPVSQTALEETGQAADLAARPRYRRDIPLGPETRLGALADILPEPAWPWGSKRTVDSVGDVLLAAGLAAWAFQVTRSAKRQPALATP
jgi:hypothetical protein